MDWVYQGNVVEQVPEGVIGFVYRITNLTTGREYIGKKNFYAAKTNYKTVTVKTGANAGTKKKKKIRSKIESDWATYHGSSDALSKDVTLLGEDAFSRVILKMCTSKAELSYYEAKYQFTEDVLLHPEKYYNSWISVRVRGQHLDS